MTLFEILDHIKKRPQMHFEQPLTLVQLEAFIYGFQTAMQKKEILSPNGMNWEYFNAWLTGAIKKTLPENIGWRKRIEHILKDEENAVDIFFDLILKFSNGKVNTTKKNTKPISLNWKRGNGKTGLENLQEIEEIIVRFEIIEHEFSKTKFKIGYNSVNFKVYVEPLFEGKPLRTYRYTEIKKNY